MDQNLENEIDLKIERAFRSYTNKVLKGEGGYCETMHTLIANDIKKCVENKIDKAREEQIAFYKRIIFTGIGGIITIVIAQIILNVYFQGG